jgi:hypothetical protein
MTIDIETIEQQWTITANDRCDSANCGAQAYVITKGIGGELFFCAHHYNKLNGEKLKSFAFEIVDERDRLIENKSQGDDY